MHKKDTFRNIFEKMVQADGILLGSPVYTANVSANMQAFLERAAVVCDLNPGLLTHKTGAAVTAARRGGALQAIDSMNHFFLNHEMFDVLKDQEGLDNAGNLGRNMAYLMKTLQKGQSLI